MAKNRWARYRPPEEQRSEGGASSAEARTSSATSSSAASPAASSSSSADESGRPRRSIAKIVTVGAVAALVIVGVAAGIAASRGGGEEAPDPVDTQLFEVAAIDAAFDQAEAEFGARVIQVRLTDYQISVETFLPNKDELRTYSKSRSLEGYEIRVEPNHYDDYQPPPFELGDLDTDALVSVADTALDRLEGVESLNLTIESVDGQIEVDARARSEDDGTLRLRADADGEILSEDIE